MRSGHTTRWSLSGNRRLLPLGFSRALMHMSGHTEQMAGAWERLDERMTGKKMDRGMRWQRRGIWEEYGELCSKVWGTVSNKRHIMSASFSEICRASAQTKNWPWLHCYGYLAGIRAAPRIIKDIIQPLVSIERELIWQCNLKSCQLICKHYTSTGFGELGLAAF